MAKELDLSGVDDILNEPVTEKQEDTELDLSGVDDVLNETSFLDKEIPLTPFFDPTLRDVGNAGGSVLETGHDAALGATQGLMFNAADEIGGAVSAGLDATVDGIAGLIPGTDANKLKQLEAEGFQMPEESLVDKYKMYQKNSEKEFDKASDRSPWAYGAGQLGGGIVGGIAAGAKLGVNAATKVKPILDIAKDQGKLKAGIELLKRGGTNYVKASPLLAAEGVTGSKGSLIGGTDEEQAQVAKDVGSNMAFGLPVILGMQGVEDLVAPAAKKGAQKVAKWAGDMVEDSDFAQQMKIMKEYGEQGINPVARKNKVKLGPGEEGLIRRETTRAQGIMDDILKADEALGKDVGASIQRAEQSGARFNLDDVVDDSFSSITKSYDIMQEIGANSRGRDILNRIANRTAQEVSPSEAKMLLDDVDAFINKFKSASNRNVTEQTILDNLIKFRGNLSKTMKKAIPEYGKAAGRFEEFRRLIPETVMSGSTPQEVSGVYMGSLKNPERNLLTKLKDITKGATSTGSADDVIKESYENTIQGMNKWQAAEAARGTQNPLSKSPDEYAKLIRDYANDAAARRSATTVAEAKSIGSNAITALSGVGQSSRSLSLGAANLYGRAAKNIAPAAKKAGQLSRKVYNMPAERLNEAAARMQQIPGLQTLGRALKEGLDSGDQAKKNAALFSIMQNPNAALIFDEED